MKKIINKKFLVLSICIIVLNLLIKGFLVTSHPNSINPEEIDLITRLSFLKSFDPYSLRYIIVAISSLFTTLSFILLYRITKNLSWSFLSGLLLTYSPWIFIISRYSNFYLVVLSLCISSFLFFYKSKLKYILIFFLIFISGYFLYQNKIFITNNYINDFGAILRLIDFKNLYFTGDYTSSFIRIPKTGFFLLFEFLIFLYGIYTLVFEPCNNKVKRIIFEIFLIGFIWFFITPSNLIISNKSMFIFYSIGLVIAFGYSSLMSKRATVAWFIMPLIICGFIFYQELFYFHFDIKNSSDWGFSEEKISKFLETNAKNLNFVYVSKDASSFIKYLPIFGKNFVTKKVNIIENDWIRDKALTICIKKKVICILKESDLKPIGLGRDNLREKIYYYNGLTAYLILSKESLTINVLNK